jgi:hypothetical protein
MRNGAQRDEVAAEQVRPDRKGDTLEDAEDPMVIEGDVRRPTPDASHGVVHTRVSAATANCP